MTKIISAEEARKKIANNIKEDKYFKRAVNLTLKKINENIEDSIKMASNHAQLRMYDFMHKSGKENDELFQKIYSHHAVIDEVMGKLRDLGYNAWLNDLTIKVEW